MKKSSIILVISLLLIISSPLAQTGQCHEAPNVIKFGVFPYKSPRTIVSLFAPIVKRLEAALGIKVQLVTAPDYKSYVERGKAGEYDLALPCVSCYFLMQDAGYSVIAKGEPVFYGGTVVRRDSGITSIDQLKGRKVAAIGKHSFAGYLFLVQQLDDKGIDATEEVEFTFLGKLDSILYGVINKQYAAGTVRRDALKSKVFKELEKDLVFISTSGAIPQFPFVAKKDMPAEQVEKIRQVLTSISMDNAADFKILKSLRLTGISRAQDSDYEEFHAIFNRAQELTR